VNLQTGRRTTELERSYVGEVLENQFQSSRNNIFTARLEDVFARTFHSRYAIAFANGTATLHTALAALGIGPGDEVIVPPLTMASTSLAVLHAGAVPVFADVERDSFTLAAASVQDNITPRTRAVISVALYGQPPDYDSLLTICARKKLFLVEDNAQAFLSEYRGRTVGTFGEFSSFSFQASKHLTCGEGGMLTTNREEYADAARRFSSLGYGNVNAKKGKISKKDLQDPDFARHVCYGFNYRMSELQAAVACAQVERIRELVRVRTDAAAVWREAMKDVEWLVPQSVPEDCVNSYWTFAARLDVARPEEAWRRFRDLFVRNGGDGIYAAWRLTYCEPFFVQEVQGYPEIKQRYEPGLCPNAEYLQKRMLQFKTNYWNGSDAERQAEILRRTIVEYENRYLTTNSSTRWTGGAR